MFFSNEAAMKRKVYAIILASGKGERLNYSIPKQFIKIAGKTIIEHTIDTFQKNSLIDEIIIVIEPSFRNHMEEIVLHNSYTKISRILNGGATRRESSSIGVNAVTESNAKILIHDAVRPFISNDIINECVTALDRYDAIDVAIPATDTIIKTNSLNCIESIPERKFMMQGQTPQAFNSAVIKEAHSLALKDNNETVTDDCGLILKYRLADVFVVKGETRNIKITYIEDVVYADKLFQLQNEILNCELDPAEMKNKVVVIFGASKGIGKAVSELAESCGAKVHGYSRETGVDVSSYLDVEKTLKEVDQKENRIDFVINTAAVLRIGKIEDRSINDLEEEIRINYMGSINVVKASIPYLKKSEGGALLFTSSSYTRGRALYSSYSSAKAAIVNLVQAAAEELLPYKIRINAINPERTATPMRFTNFGNEPAGSLLQPEKVAVASLTALLSDMTGQVIYVRK